MKPILFSTEMVQAILDGRKTQTRRVINPQPIKFRTEYPIPVSEAIKDNKALIKKGYALLGTSGPLSGYIYGKPKYHPGDNLWVRETWIKSEYATNIFYYKTDKGVSGNWKPSIRMPKEAARIFLEVTDVRAERLQDISEEDAIAEGVEIPIIDKGILYKHYGEPKTLLIWATDSFQTLWQKIKGKKHPWESNPWVWVYSFKRIEKPENF